MVTLICDRCERQIQVQTDTPGTKVQCPNCGDWNVVRAPSNAAPSPASAPSASVRYDKAVALGLPPAGGPEQTVLKLHPASFKAHPFAYSMVLLGLGGGAVGGGIFLMQSPPQTVLASVCGLVALLAAGTMAVWAVARRTEALVVTTERVKVVRGLLRRDTNEINHADIKNIQIKQSLFERVMGIGQIGISSAGQDEIEIVMDGVPDPHRISQVIGAYREESDWVRPGP